MSLETGNEGFLKKFTILYLGRFSPCLLIALYKFKCPETKVVMYCEPFHLKILHLSLDTCYSFNILIHKTLENNTSQSVPMSLIR